MLFNHYKYKRVVIFEMDHNKEKLLSSLYYNFDNETAFTSKSKIYKKAKTLDKTIKRKQYTAGIHKPTKKIKNKNIKNVC